jgi:CHASE2 domain-containing sensor protein/two-component sensor histidine kinase
VKASIFRKIKRLVKVWQQGAMPGTVVVGLVILVRLAGALQPLEWAAYDRFLRWRPIEPVDDRITIIGINEDDIRAVGYPISDRELAGLLNKLASYKPRAIGLDIFRDQPLEPGHAEIIKAFREIKNLIGIEKSILPETVDPPPELPLDQQVGFADVLIDGDGHVRRNLISSPRLHGGYQFSLAERLAELYLKAEGIEPSNGILDKNALRFDRVELTRFQSNDGGYIRTDMNGNQLLMNWRSGQKRFKVLSLLDIKNNNFKPEQLRDRIVVIGITATSYKDIITVPAVADDFIDGVEFHAHSASQIVSAVLDGRPLLRSLPDIWEYVLILGWGGLGIAIALILKSPFQSFLSLGAASIILVASSYGFLVLALWLPVVPTLMAFLGAGLVTRYIQDLRSLIEQRQQIINQRQRTLDEAFNALHNGPLHSLAEILSVVRVGNVDPQKLGMKLENLDRELRDVYESIRPDSQTREVFTPIHEQLYEIYHKTLQRDFAGFQQLKVKIPDIQPIEDDNLTAEQKREMCIFLEEALCNVGKHAIGATQLFITCKKLDSKYVLSVTDNGVGIQSTPGKPSKEQGGTKQAKDLARSLGGSFKRSPHSPNGTVCEITWTG